jgi:hypothetical protein
MLAHGSSPFQQCGNSRLRDSRILSVGLADDMVHVQTSRLFVPCRLPAEMIAAPGRPVNDDDEDDDAVDGADVVHIYPHLHQLLPLPPSQHENYERGKLTTSLDRHSRRERVHNKRKPRPSEQDDVGEEAQGAHPERAVEDVVAAAEKEAEDGDGVGEVEEDDAGGNHARMEEQC